MEAYDGACDVQNIDFVKIVATGKEPMSAFCDLTTHHIDNDTNMNDMYEPWGADDKEGDIVTDPAGLADNEICHIGLVHPQIP